MKKIFTNKIKKSSKLAIAFFLTFAMIASVFSATALSFKTAFADYSASSSYSDNFSKAPTWTQQSNIVSEKIKDYANINFSSVESGGNFSSYNITSLSAPTTRHDGSSINDAASSGIDNYCLGLFANGLENVTGESSAKVYNRMVKTVSSELKSNSYYVLTCYVYTAGDANATIKLSGSVEYETTSLSSVGAWSKVNIFFATLSESYSSINLNLNYGSYEQVSTSATTTGYVLFDELDILKITETDFVNKTINNNATSGTTFSYNPNAERTVATTLDSEFSSSLSLYSKFEEDSEFNDSDASAKDWFYYAPEGLSSHAKTNYYNAYNAQTTGETPEAKYFSAETVREDAVFETNTFGANNYVLKIINKTSDLNLGLVSSAFTVNQLSYYRVSVMMKADQSSNSARLVLLSKIPTIAKPDGALFSAFRSNSPYTISSAVTNNWVEVAMYIRGNAFHDVSTRIALLCGTNSTVYFDHIKIEKITSSEYTNAYSSYKLDLSPTSLVQTESIANGYFNYGAITDATMSTPYLFAPDSWSEAKVGYTDIASGVIPTRSAVYGLSGEDISSKLGTVANPIPTEAQINVLAIYADPTKFPTSAEKLEDTFTTSSTFSLASASTMIISFDVFTASTLTNANFTGDVIARLTYNDNQIVDFVTNYTSGTGTWETYRIVVRTGAASRAFKLSIGISNAQGTVFFRNVKYAASLTDYNELLETYPTWASQKSANIRFVDFVEDCSTTHLTQTITDKNYYASNNYKVTEIKDSNETVISGEAFIVDVNTGATLTSDLTLTSANLELSDASSDMALVILNTSEKQSAVSPLGSSTLTKNSYYKISVWVKTNSTVGDNFTIKFNGTDLSFNKVNTADVTTNNGYVEYIGYIKTGSNDVGGVSVSFILGTSDNKAEGYAIIRDIKIDNLTELSYTTAVNAVTAEDTTVKVKDYTASSTSSSSQSSSSDDSDENEDYVSGNQLSIFFIVFSSLLLVATMVVAIVAVVIRKSVKPAKVAVNNIANVKPKKTTRNKKSNKEPDGFV